jgi:hypothetical protein
VISEISEITIPTFALLPQLPRLTCVNLDARLDDLPLDRPVLRAWN